MRWFTSVLDWLRPPDFTVRQALNGKTLAEFKIHNDMFIWVMKRETKYERCTLHDWENIAEQLDFKIEYKYLQFGFAALRRDLVEFGHECSIDVAIPHVKRSVVAIARDGTISVH